MTDKKVYPAGKNGMRPVPPYEVLKEDYLEPLGITDVQLFERIGYTAEHYEDWVTRDYPIDHYLATRLAIVFKTTPDLWLNLHHEYSLKMANESLEHETWLKSHIKPLVD